MEEIILEARNLWFSYEQNEEHSLRGLNVKIKKGQRIAFMGANGSGKSTFFLCCNGIHQPQKGEVYFKGEKITYRKKKLLELRSHIGIVFQDPDHQLFSASVRQEISFGILNMGVDIKTAEQKVDAIMDALEITPFQSRPVHALSGGEKKQVSIADILVMDPEVVILDEPAASLDPKHTKMVYRIIDRLTERGITVVMSTHDVDHAYAWADEVVLMHEGKALCQGKPEEVFRRRDFLQKTNLDEPAVLRLYDKLCRRGILKQEINLPRTLDELERMI